MAAGIQEKLKMATMAFLRGWLHCGADLAPRVKRAVEMTEFADLSTEQQRDLYLEWLDGFGRRTVKVSA